MNVEELQKLELQPGAKVLVHWFDAAEIYKSARGELTDEDAVTLLESVGEYVGIHTSPFYPNMPYLILYEGCRKIYNPNTRRFEMKHVYSSIPLPLVHSVEVLKRIKKARKIPALYVVVLEGGEKRFLRGKVA